MPRPPVSEQVQVNFRMPIGLRDRIKVAAERNGRSMNSEIVAALEDKFPEVSVWMAAINALREMNDTIDLLPEGPEKLEKIVEARSFFHAVMDEMLPRTGHLEADSDEAAEIIRELRSYSTKDGLLDESVDRTPTALQFQSKKKRTARDDRDS